MDKLQGFVQHNQILTFLILTFIISGAAFVLMWSNSKWQTPENFEALPVWIGAVWSPTFSAFIVWSIQGELLEKLRLVFSIPTFSPWFFILLVPIFVLIALMYFHQSEHFVSPATISFNMIIMLVLLNLVLGPLGEEAGWRGLLLPAIQDKAGWMAAALIIGFIWTVWHAPLWLIKSPQSEIDFLVFSGHVFCYSILMAMIFMESKGSIIPVIIFHLLVNVITGYLSLLGSMTVNEIYRVSLYYYAASTIVIVGVYEILRTKTCQVG